ncbi:MAG: aminoglycoside phosphotransferase family protein [Verrucomicrobiaceae bacterium]|nr:aminoglycoside phosphotransferase family protein [Verrucomicrobiaceae bacterium]
MNTEEILPLLRDAGLITGEARVTPLAGGVSSDIALIESAQGKIVVKAALEKLRVKDDWFADVARNRVEQDYFDYAANIIPRSVPRILGSGPGWFAMEYLGDMPNWKSQLLAGNIELSTAQLAGEVLGRLHGASWLDPVARDRFATLPNFHALRIEPYLLTTAARVPEAAEFLRREAAMLAQTRLALVHGDYSPKNLLTGPQRLVVLDAECAWFGDPAFDVAFMLSHLLLKALLHRDTTRLVPEFWFAYAHGLELMRESHDASTDSSVKFLGNSTLRSFAALETRMTRLLLCLLLARVHGKSPVEYLSDDQRAHVTRFVLARLPEPPPFPVLVKAW